MWSHRFTSEVDLAPAQLWPVLANINGWSTIDTNIAYIRLDGVAQPGARFYLKPKGGPRLNFKIGRFEPPTHYSDICQLFLAEMETTHSLRAIPAGSAMEVVIEIRGPLSWLWGRTIGAKHAKGLPAQTERFIHAARSM